MKAERVILSFIAVVIGLIAAGVAFYLYQSTKVLPANEAQPLEKKQKTIAVSPTPDNANLLTISSPKDEEIFDKKVISITGKTRPDATVVVTTESNDDVIKPAANGDFSVTETIPNGTTIMYITAIFPNGEEQTVKRTVSFSTEQF